MKDYTTYEKKENEKREDELVKETLAAYQIDGTKQQGEYTLEDYYAIPEDQRVELIDGVIYDMAAPNVIHQMIELEIRDVLKAFVEKNRGECLVLAAPLDVQLDRDNKTMVQPDVLVICNRDQILKRGIYGQPDFVVEVLSPETKKKDMFLKLKKYREAGVKEYWMVDPEERRVIVYNFLKDMNPVFYTFENIVPVGIFGERCKVDFGEIYRKVEFLYDR